MKRLNIGCGTDIRDGWINVDKFALPGVDVVHDIESVPLPFGTDEFEYILCQDVLEHVDCIPLMKELARILRPGGGLRIRVPHFTSRNAYGDPTHKRLFCNETFAFFCKGHKRDYCLDFHFSSVKTRITFEKSPFFFWNYVIEYIVNLSPKTRIFYEASCLRVFPAENIEAELIR